MKKTLSIIVILAMILSMVPVAFATNQVDPFLGPVTSPAGDDTTVTLPPVENSQDSTSTSPTTVYGVTPPATTPSQDQTLTGQGSSYSDPFLGATTISDSLNSRQAQTFTMGPA